MKMNFICACLHMCFGPKFLGSEYCMLKKGSEGEIAIVCICMCMWKKFLFNFWGV